MYRERRLQFRQHFDVCAYQLLVHIQLDILPLVIDTNENIQPAAFESIRNFLADDVFKILVFTRNLDVNIEVSMVDALNLNQYGQTACLGPGGTKPGHAVDHELTS